jgi:hypothetical protein
VGTNLRTAARIGPRRMGFQMAPDACCGGNAPPSGNAHSGAIARGVNESLSVRATIVERSAEFPDL